MKLFGTLLVLLLSALSVKPEVQIREYVNEHGYEIIRESPDSVFLHIHRDQGVGDDGAECGEIYLRDLITTKPHKTTTWARERTANDLRITIQLK